MMINRIVKAVKLKFRDVGVETELCLLFFDREVPNLGMWDVVGSVAT
jgi:hypothetical protein